MGRLGLRTDEGRSVVVDIRIVDPDSCELEERLAVADDVSRIRPMRLWTAPVSSYRICSRRGATAYRSLVRSVLDGCPSIGSKLSRACANFATISSGVILRWRRWPGRCLEDTEAPVLIA